MFRVCQAPDSEILCQGGDRSLLGVLADARPDRCASAHPLLEVGLRAPPVGVKEAVGAVPGDRHGVHSRANRLGALAEGRAARGERGELGEVVADQPEAGWQRVVPLKDDDASGDAPHLAQARDRIGPVVVGEDRHRGVEGLIGKGQSLGRCGDAGRGVADRCARITAEGSTAVTFRSGGRRSRFPHPRSRRCRASPSAAQIRLAIRGSVQRAPLYGGRLAGTQRAVSSPFACHDG